MHIHHRYLAILACATVAGSFSATLSGCSSTDFGSAFRESVDGLIGSTTSPGEIAPLRDEDIVEGLRQALRAGVQSSTRQASQSGGYLDDAELHIPIPPALGEFPIRLRRVGLGNTVDRFEITLNTAAETAASQAGPIFVQAVRAMTIQDGWGILRGDDDAATQYFERATYDDLYAAFLPEVRASLGRVGCTKMFADLVTRYNAIPGLTDVSFNLEDYTTRRAIDGLFILISKEEMKIREDPAARTTALLRRVFAPETISEN